MVDDRDPEAAGPAAAPSGSASASASASASTHSGASLQSRRRRVARILIALVLLIAAAVAILMRAPATPSGTAWLLSLVPGLTVIGPNGSLIGDFAAEHIEVAWPGRAKLVLEAPGWHGLAVSRGDHGRWLRLTIATLHAERVRVEPRPAPKPASTESPSAPSTLRLPIELVVQEASIGELRIGSAAATPLRDLRARIELGADGGAQHRIEGLAGSYDKARGAGSAALAADPPFAVTALLDIAAADSVPAWQARVAATGPLASLNINATARVAASATHAARPLDAKPLDAKPLGSRALGAQPLDAQALDGQSFDAHAVVKPFAAWPLGELQASTAALDLSAFASGAPATSLSGKASAASSGSDRPAVLSLDLTNARAGRYGDGLLPMRRLRAELRGRPDAPSVADVQTLVADLGSALQDGGRIVGSGRWAPDRANLTLELQKVRPSALDARAPQAALDGTVRIVGTGLNSGAAPPAPAPMSKQSANGSPHSPSNALVEGRAIQISALLSGQLLDPAIPRAAPRAARLRLEARASEHEIDIRSFDALLGEAHATLSGRLSRPAPAAPWHAAGTLAIVDFEPAPWWPGADRTALALARAPSRIRARGAFDLTLPPDLPRGSLFDAIAATRGNADLALTASTLAGVAVDAEASFVNLAGRASAKLDIAAAGNRFSARGQFAAAGHTGDEWQLDVDAPQLASLGALITAAGAGPAPDLRGTVTAKAHVAGRWPELTSDGELHAAALRYRAVSVRRADGRWHLGSADAAKLDATLAIDELTSAGRTLEQVRARLDGSARAHRAEVRIGSQALPPEWVDAAVAHASAAASAMPAAPALAAGPNAPASRSEALLTVEGGLVDANGTRAAGWRGRLVDAVVRSAQDPSRRWLHMRDIGAAVTWSGGPLRADIEPGQAEAFGTTLHWNRISYEGAAGDRTGPKLDLQASIDPVALAPILRRLQPDFGWQGDLAVAARVDVRSSPAPSADIVVERVRGDLAVEQDQTRQPLGLTVLRVGIGGRGGGWSADVAVAGRSFGDASGHVAARTGSAAAWPDATTPIDGAFELRAADLGTLGIWTPAGWRLGGSLHATARIGGQLGAPRYTGRIDGAGVSARNFVQGVDVTDGELAIALDGDSARVERFRLRAGSGTATLTGSASLGVAPSADLRLSADAFQLLGRVDRRIVTSGDARLRLDGRSIAVTGRFKVDEGLIDFTRADAPTLGDDVEVVRRRGDAPAPATQTQALAATPVQPAVGRKVELDLRVDVGERLRIRGRGLDAGLRGELHATSPQGRLSADGSIRAVDGTYQAYGQKLKIDRAVISFAGSLDNPRLDVEATRPDLDVRVGVVVTGSVLNPRIRLFSQPELSDVDKLSWLVLGKPSTATGSTGTALLQRAALALLSGEGPGATDRVTQSLGLDELSVRAGEGGVKDAIVSVGKQLSKRWYVGYERGINATTGSWQLIYRIAQRFTVKAAAGGDNAIDVNWTLRWR